MSSIDKLIAKLCPKGVEFKALGEIAELVRGSGLPKSDFAESGIGCIHYGQIYTHYGVSATETISFVTQETARPLAKVDSGDIVITNTSENLEDVCKAVAWLGTSQIVTGGHATVIKHGQDPRFLSYYFRTPEFFAQKKKHAVGTKVIDVSATNLAKIRVPIPPLEIQREIVKVLNNFTRLETELEAALDVELEARQKQYKYYLDSLLTFDAMSERENVRWATLGEVGTFIRGNGIQKKDLMGSGVGAIHYGQIHTHYGTSASVTKSFVNAHLASKARKALPGDLVIATTSEDDAAVAKAVAWIGTEDVAVSGDAYIYRHQLAPQYISYFFQSAQFQDQKKRHITGTKVRRISGDSLAKIRIPFPPRAEQARIAAILDKFNALDKNLSEGLHAEIAARRKQYAHHRDHLLTFKEAA